MTPDLNEPRDERRPHVRLSSMAAERLAVSLASRSFSAERFHWAGFLAISFAALLGDQLLKGLVARALALGESASLPGPFSLEHVRNSGIAFGLFSGWTSYVSALTVLCVGGLFLYFSRAGARRPLLTVALGLLAGGSISNLADRLRLGYVTDYLGLRHWPSFNLADMFVVTGIVLLVAAFRAADVPGRR